MFLFVRDDEPTDLRPAGSVGPVLEFPDPDPDPDPAAGGRPLLVLPAGPGAIPVSRYRALTT
ncbi:hypothetical protein [Streptomyces triticirhizae]|uniref:Uncharacterized protein n=1 Tax=Streptomyces triticirhizae TaxID=2483353 RepID=A0A3M2LS67_9ACTN|nr:hypothetical protein [Streptomyces triticirhizae]RMI39750.1 hypothetical protein EBN88_14260 [Streptomyces triticirhizae]